MADKKPLFKAPYDIKDVSALFAIVAFVLIFAALVGNNLFGLFQENVNFGWFNYTYQYIFEFRKYREKKNTWMLERSFTWHKE